MRICVMSDTHIPDRNDDIPADLMKEVMNADMIVHAGDFTSLDFYKELKGLKPLKAVVGNMDSPELRNELKDKEIFTVQGYKIGIVHGHGKPEKILENIRSCFDEKLDLVIFGHSHQPFNEKIGKCIFFNPGSPTDKIFSPCNTYGIIEINEEIHANIERIR